jgi:hypothetical protein
MSLALVTKGKLWPKYAVVREEIEGIEISVSELDIGISVSDEPSYSLLVDSGDFNICVTTSEDSIAIEVEEVDELNFNVGCE